MSNSIQRDPYLDNARFLLVSLVVLGHMLSPVRGEHELIYQFNNFLSLFRMPALIFVTGFFAKSYYKEGYVEKIFVKLFIPYVTFQYLFGYYYSLLYDGRSFSVDFLFPQYTLWFLLALFIWNCLLFVFSRLKNPVFISLIIALLIGASERAGHYSALHRVFVFFPFFLMGFYATREHLDKIKSIFWAYGVLFLVLGFLLLSFFVDNADSRNLVLGNRSYSRMGFSFSEGVFLRSFVIFLSVITMLSFLSIVPRKMTFFTKLGTRSAYIYILHGFLVRTLYEAGLRDWFSGYELLGAIFAITIFLIFVLSTKPVVNVTRFAIEGAGAVWIKDNLLSVSRRFKSRVFKSY